MCVSVCVLVFACVYYRRSGPSAGAVEAVQLSVMEFIGYVYILYIYCVYIYIYMCACYMIKKAEWMIRMDG